jgi:hypothetical protein
MNTDIRTFYGFRQMPFSLLAFTLNEHLLSR